jgi:hypothetical protein
MSEREQKLLTLLQELRNAEWMVSCDWCPQENRDSILEKVDAALAMFPEAEGK